MLKRNYNAMRPAFSNVIDTQEYHEDKVKEINQGLKDIVNEKNSRLRADITKNLLSERKRHLLRTASLKEENIKSVHHPYGRSYKELFHFFKFPLVKRRPKTRYFITSEGQKQIEPFTKHINFQGVELKVTNYGGELGDPDRMVWLAVMNNGIRHLEFVQEFGWIPYSRADIARDANLDQDRKKVTQALKKLRLTDVEFKNPFGKFAYKGGFHLIDSVKTIKVNDLKSQVDETIESKNIITDKAFIAQAQRMMESIKPKTPKINLVSYHRNLMDAMIANRVTTIDYWALNKLEGVSEKTLFLYFYDVSQWYKAHTPKKISLQELLALSDVKLHVRRKKGKEYPEWRRAKDQIESYLIHILPVSKFIIYWEWLGEKEHTILQVYLDKDVRQIPSKPPKI